MATIRSYWGMGDLLAVQQRFAEAEEMHRRALAIYEKAIGKESARLTELMTDLAFVLHCQGREHESDTLLNQALAIKKRRARMGSKEGATLICDRAKEFFDKRRLDESRALYCTALHILQNALGPVHPEVASCLDTLSQVNSTQEREAEARFYSRWASAIRAQMEEPPPGSVQ